MAPQTPLKTGAWDPDEDELLYYWQSKVGNKWSEVAKHIPGRTGQQCAQRWRHKVNPNIRRDKWTEDEDAHLMELVKTFGIGKWAEIARHMQGRTDQQCMGRWRRHLDPNIRRDSWSPEEDQRLRALHQQHGTSWSRISKALKGRTSQQCRARWHQLDSGRSRRSGGGGSGSGGQGSIAGGGGRGTGGRRKAARSRRRYESSDSEEYEEEELCESEVDEGYEEEEGQPAPARSRDKQEVMYGGVGSHAGEGGAAAACGPGMQPVVEERGEAGDEEQDGSGGGHVGESAALAPRRRLVARKHPHQQQPQDAPAPAPVLPPMLLSPLQPQLAGLCSGASTPQRHGRAGAFDSPGAAVGFLSPHLASPLGSGRKLSVGGCYEESDPDSAQAAGWQHLAQAQGLDDEEAAGAETLLQMAAVLRRGSGDLEAPGAGAGAGAGGVGGGALRRSDFILGSTPTKRSPAQRPHARPSDDLSSSPLKKAHTFEDAGAAAGVSHAAAGLSNAAAGFSHASSSAASFQQDFRRRLAAAAAATGTDEHRALVLLGGGGAAGPSSMDGGQAPIAAAAAARSGGARRLTAKRSAARRGGVSALPFRATGGGGEGADEDAVDDAAAGEADGRGGLVDGQEGMAPVGFDLNAAIDFMAAGGHVGSVDATSSPGHAAHGSALTIAPLAVGFMSPPAPRGVEWGAGDASTPGRQVVNLLSSPGFERLIAGCATPTTLNAHSQPSPATLALLQSPQASAMLEPFWTPLTGLAKDSLLHSASATPDPNSAARRKSAAIRGLFSPPSATKRDLATSAEQQIAAMADAAAAVAAAAVAQQDAARELQQGVGAGAGGSGAAAATAGAAGTAAAPSQPHNRVVRRLDQHEAWGAAALAAAAPADAAALTVAAAAAPARAVGSPARAAAGGSELMSPPKRARVPLFCEGPAAGAAAGVAAGAASPPRPVPVKLEFDSVAAGRSGNSTRPYEPSRLNPASGARAGGGAGVGLGGGASLTGRSPSRPASWKLPPASSLLTSPPGVTKARRRLAVPQAVVDAAANMVASPVQQQLAGEEGACQQLPGTPDHDQLLGSQQSTSATPATPSAQLPPGGGCEGGGGDGVSPSDYVTPQQRVQMAPPIAPLHRDRLIAPAASVAAARQVPMQDGGEALATVTSKVPAAHEQQAGCGNQQQQQSARGQERGWINQQQTVLPADCHHHEGQQVHQAVDDFSSPPVCYVMGVAESDPMSISPLEAGQPPASMGPSPNWGPGMMAILQGLQRTPLAVCKGEAAAAPEAAAALGAQMLEPSSAAQAQAPATFSYAATPATQALPAVISMAMATPMTHAHPLVISMPMATPMTLQASQLSEATPLALSAPLPAFGTAPTALDFTPLAAGPPDAPTPMSGTGSDTSSNKENAEATTACALGPPLTTPVHSSAGAGSSGGVPLSPTAPPAAAALPPAWLQGGAPLTMHLVPVKLQLQQGALGAPMQAVVSSAGAPKTVASVMLTQPGVGHGVHGALPAHAVTVGAGDGCGSAEARSRLHALLEGL